MDVAIPLPVAAIEEEDLELQDQSEPTREKPSCTLYGERDKIRHIILEILKQFNWEDMDMGVLGKTEYGIAAITKKINLIYLQQQKVSRYGHLLRDHPELREPAGAMILE